MALEVQSVVVIERKDGFLTVFLSSNRGEPISNRKSVYGLISIGLRGLRSLK